VRGPSGGTACWASRIQEVSATFAPEKEAIWNTDDSSGKKRPSLKYFQITSGERYTLGALHTQGFSQAEIARLVGRHSSTIGRELKRNSTRYDGAYRHSKAQERTGGRRSRSNAFDFMASLLCWIGDRRPERLQRSPNGDNRLTTSRRTLCSAS
jgi:IS30 family transposase